jgi:glycosyltransferase involved in cell wall biosynthesis
MRRPLITVITAVRNGERFLEETIRSIQAQNLSDFEYLIVDDASTDSTARVVEQLAAADKRLRLIQRSSSGGPYVAANDALASSRGQYIMRTDGDDLQPPDRFTRQLDFLKNNSKRRACVTAWQAYDGQRLVEGSIATTPAPGAFKWNLLLRGASVHSSLCIETEALLQLGGYRAEALSQDYRLLCELTRRGWLGVMPDVLSYVRQHPDRATNRRTALQRQLALDVLADHWQALTGTECSPTDQEALWAIGYSLPFDLQDGLSMLRRWDQLWSADHTLEPLERLELRRLSALRRRKFLRSNLRRNPAATIFAALKCGFSWEPAVSQ